MSLSERIHAAFNQQFHAEPLLVRAPGRINIIGEHTDYNNGFVLPAAIDKEIVFAIKLRGGSEHTCRVHAQDLEESYSFDLQDFAPLSGHWANYIMGVVDQFQKRGFEVPAFDCVFGGNIPQGAGLSSSAALECGIAYGLIHLCGWEVDRLQMVQLAQLAEHTFPGVKCGIMDQFASTMGKKNHVVRLDCRSLEYEYFPCDIPGYQLILCNSQVSHSLASSEYNVRREQCEEGVRILQTQYPEITSLRDVNPQQLESFRDKLDPLIYNRCRFVVDENIRVLAACEAMQAGDWLALGGMMFQTHSGLQHLYEVSCEELDILIELTKRNLNVLGARMMGGGFGGCTLNLVKESAISSFKEHMQKGFFEATGQDLPMYEVRVRDGVGLVK